MILHIITFRKIYPNILNSESKFICSELIASAFYKITGINFSKLSSVGYVTPGDIADFAKTSENAEIVFKS